MENICKETEKPRKETHFLQKWYRFKVLTKLQMFDRWQVYYRCGSSAQADFQKSGEAGLGWIKQSLLIVRALRKSGN